MVLPTGTNWVFAASPTAKFADCLVLNFALLIASLVPSEVFAQNRDSLSTADLVQQSLDSAFPATEVNAYDQALINPTFEQARRFQEDGSHAEAVKLYKEAIHILRINHGLYNDAQIDLIDAMIESEITLQNWEQVDKHYGYLENLYRKLYDISDPRLEIGLQKVVTWHVNALNFNIDGKRIEHLQQANKLFKLRLQIAQHTLHIDDPKLEYLNRNIEICERQLFLASDLNREMQKLQKRRQGDRPNAVLADRE